MTMFNGSKKKDGNKDVRMKKNSAKVVSFLKLDCLFSILLLII
jgi:hypothetical protein